MRSSFRRTRLGRTRAQVVAETGVAASTIRRGGNMELDGVVWLLQWLGCPFEVFVRDGAAPLDLRNAEFAPDDGHSPGAPRWPDYRRFDTSELFAALERERLAGGMTWADVAAEVAGPGMTPATLKAF
ncbi:MAG TPA: hypothetical protein PKD27_13750, partial [Tepidiformaceae bacterium]|nr:hypothetical protein [Tepidiformaceae bacterium]